MNLRKPENQDRVNEALAWVLYERDDLSALVAWAAANTPALFIDAIGVHVGGKFRGHVAEKLAGQLLSTAGLDLGKAHRDRQGRAAAAEHGPPLVNNPWFASPKNSYRKPTIGDQQKIWQQTANNISSIERVGGDWTDGFKLFLVEQFGLLNKGLVDPSGLKPLYEAGELERMFPFAFPELVVPTPHEVHVLSTRVEDNPAVESW